MSRSAWEAIFMLAVLKIPMIYLGSVVWYAVRAEPRPETGPDELGVLAPLDPCGWEDWKRSRPRHPLSRGPLRPLPRRTARRATVS
jgi:hypothetical protein